MSPPDEAVKWPPDEAEWRELLRDLPHDLPDENRRKAREAIGAAVREYQEDAGRDEQRGAVWRQIRRVASSPQIEKLCRVILQLNNFSQQMDQAEVTREVAEVERLRRRADSLPTIELDWSPEAVAKRQAAADAVARERAAVRDILRRQTHEFDQRVAPMAADARDERRLFDSVAEAMLRQVEPLRQICSDAGLRATMYLSKSRRRGRLLSQLSLAWTVWGRGALPKAETGSFVDFMVDITGRVFSRPVGGSGIKKFVGRERARRLTLRLRDQILLSGEGSMKADAYLIDADGLRVPD